MNYYELMMTARKMSYRALQIALKELRYMGLTQVKLNVKREVLESEYLSVTFKEAVKEQELQEKTLNYQVEKFAEVAETTKDQVIEFCLNGDDMATDLRRLANDQKISFEDMTDKINETYRIFCLPKNLKDNEFTLLNFIANKLYISEEEALRELQAI